MLGIRAQKVFVNLIVAASKRGASLGIKVFPAAVGVSTGSIPKR